MRDPSSVPTNYCGGLALPVLDINGDSAAADHRQGLAAARFAGGRVEVNGVHGAPSDDVDGGVGVGVVGGVVGAPVTGTRCEDVDVNGGGAGGCGSDVAVDRSTSSSSRPPLPQRRAGARGSGSWPPRPDSFSFHTVIKALATAGMWEDAVEMLEEMADERWVTPLCVCDILSLSLCRLIWPVRSGNSSPLAPSSRCWCSSTVFVFVSCDFFSCFVRAIPSVSPARAGVC